MSSAVFLGQRVASMELDDALTVSRVNIDVDDENYYTAGTDTGTIVNVSCPWATAAMAQSVLSAMSAYTYRPYTAEDALLDPAAELGDAVTVGGIYSIIASLDIDYNRASVAEISAPGLDEIDDEYPYITQERKETNKVLAQARSIIRKTADEIEVAVEGQIDGIENTVTSLSVTLDGVTITDDTGTTRIRGSSIETSTLYVDAAHINGTLSADQINLTGAITWSDLNSSTQTTINNAQTTADTAYTTAHSAYSLASDVDDIVTDWSYTYSGTTYIDGSRLMTGTVTASTLQGGSVELLNGSGSTSGVLTLGSASSSSYAVDLTSYAALRLVAESGNLYLQGGPRIACDCTVFHPMGSAPDLGSTSYGMWQEVFAYTAEINTSDENWKNSIEELPEKYLTMMDAITPVRYKMNNGSSNRYHTGFISQNVKAAMDAAGVSDLDFAGWCKDVDADGNDIYLLRYSEFISILWAKIKQLEGRIAMLGAS